MASSIQLLRSNNPEERPFPGNLLDGQPAINTNEQEPGLFFKASDNSIVKVGPAAITSDGNPPNTNGTGQPGNTIGELWLDKSLPIPVLKIYDGVQWVDAGSGGGGSPGIVTLQRWVKTAVGGETSLSGPDNTTQILSYTPGLEEVFLNGVLLTRDVDYFASSGTSVTSLSPLTAGDEVTVLGWTPFSVLGPIDASQLSFTQAGSGAVQRTVDNKLKDVVSVKDFGAVGDGVTDDTEAIQVAITKATSFTNPAVSTSLGRGTTVLFPKGLYKVTSAIVLGAASYLSIEGDGPLTSVIITEIDGDVFKGASVNEISIRNLGLVNIGSPTSGFAINVGGDPLLNTVVAFARYLRLENLIISGFANGLRINGALATTIRDCRMGGKNISNSYGLYLGDAVVTTYAGNGIDNTYMLQYDNSNWPVIAYVDGKVAPLTRSATSVTFNSVPPAGAKIRILERLVQGTTVSGDNIIISGFHTGFKNFVEGASFSNLIVEFSGDFAIHAEASLTANLYLENNSKAVRAFRPVKLSTNQADTSLWGASSYENSLTRSNSVVSQPSKRLISTFKLETSQSLTGSLASPGKLTFSPVNGDEDANPLYMSAGGYAESWADISGAVHFVEPLDPGKLIRLRVEYSSFSSPGVYNLYWFEYFEIGGPTSPGIDSPFISFSSCRIVSQGTRVSISAYSDQPTQSAYGSTVPGRNSYVKISTT
jgi:hypothetical protein